MNKKSLKGFTLIELLIAVAIIGILSSLIFSNMGTHKAKARDARRLDELKGFKDAIDLFFEEQGKFPDTLDEVKATFGGTIHKDPQDREYSYKNTSTANDKGYCLGTKMEILTQETNPCTTNNLEDNYTIQGP